MKSYSEILDDVETLLQDAGVDPSPPSANSVFSTAELDSLMPSALVRISQFKPWQKKTTKSTVADTRDITLTTGDKWRLLGIEKVEYLTAKNPPVYRQVSPAFDSVVSIKIDTRPPAVADIYFFWNKVHILLSATGADSGAGALSADAAADAVSLALDGLGTGTINEMTTIAITGDSTVYYVTKTATIVGNAATVSIWPPLAAAALEDAVITLSLTESTIEDMALEAYLAKWLAAKACISKATKSYAQVNTAITTIANAATAVAAIADRITQSLTDIASGRTAVALGVTAVAAIAAIIDKAEAATTGDIELARDEIDKAIIAIPLANVEFDKVAADVALGATALASGAALINTIPIAGGSPEYMGQASSDVGVAQGRLINGQSYLQEAAANFNSAASYFKSGAMELDVSGAKAQEAQVNFANAASNYTAAGVELRAASEQASEAISNLRLVATRLQVSQGGLRYEEWGRRELAQVEAELRAYGGLPQTVRYPRD